MSEITHSGKIKAIANKKVIVTFEQQEACQNCAIKSMCNLSSCENQIVEIKVDNPDDFCLEQEVELEISPQSGSFAIIMAYLLPLIIMMTTLKLTLHLINDETTAALSAIFILIPYYLLLYIFRKKIAGKIEIRIR